jgi:hypothetical protein
MMVAHLFVVTIVSVIGEVRSEPLSELVPAASPHAAERRLHFVDEELHLVNVGSVSASAVRYYYEEATFTAVLNFTNFQIIPSKFYFGNKNKYIAHYTITITMQ